MTQITQHIVLQSPTTNDPLLDLNTQPSLDLQFATSKTLDDRVSGQNLITFSRSTTGTYVDSNGLIQTAAVDAPRFDHDPVTLESLGLLVEESRTNLITYSENIIEPGVHGDFLGGWTITHDAGTAPDGNSTADQWLEITTNNEHTGYRTPLTATTVTQSIFVKGVNKQYAGLRFYYSNNDWEHVTFDLTGAGTVTDTQSGSSSLFTNVSSGIEAYPNGWYRIHATATQPSRASYLLIFNGVTSGTPTLSPVTGSEVYTGVATEGYLVWGAQLEEGPFLTSYIPTAGSTVTRAADEASITGTNFSRWYNQSEGTVFAGAFNRQIYYGSNVFPYIAQLDDGTNANRFSLDHSVLSGGYRAQFIARDGDINQASITAQAGIPSGAIKIGASYQLNSFAASSNGNAAVGDTSGTVPTVNRLQIGTGFGSQYSGTISRLTYYPYRLGDTTLQDITS